MKGSEKDEILAKAKAFFQANIMESHRRNTAKLVSTDRFNINPFLFHYLARFAFGDDSPESLARSLVYPRALGTSLNTTFGSQIQAFCNEVLSSFASTTQGMDIEFIDAYDGRRKYCQIKAGPNTINKGDVSEILDDFKGVRALARTNRLHIAMDDLVVGVLYGEKGDLSGHYRKIEEEYPVYAGREFWSHLTGDADFYDDLIRTFADAASETDSHDLLEDVIGRLSEDIKKKGL